MPLYEYECESCGATFEVIQKFSDQSVDTCRTCGGKVHRLLSAPAIQFKGTGWYITDYARKGAKGADADKPGPSTSDSASTSAPAASESKSPAAAAPTTGPSTAPSSDKT